jgi:hypothetical protein
MQKIGWPLYFLVGTLALSVPAFAEPLVKYHSNGKLSVKGHLDENGLPHEIIRKYDEEGNLLSERNFHHGVLEGVSKLYYPSGELMTHWTYKHGKRHGISHGYFRNGKLKDEGFYQDDTLDGKVKMYYEDGILKTEMNFRASLKISLLQEIEHCTRISYIGGTGFLARANRLERRN